MATPRANGQSKITMRAVSVLAPSGPNAATPRARKSASEVFTFLLHFAHQ